MRGETKITNLQWPYCPDSFRNLDNVKHHIHNNSCANNEHNQQPLRWGEIVRTNIPEIQEKMIIKKLTIKKEFLKELNCYSERITIENTQEGTKWKCAAEGRIYQTEDKQRIRNHLEMMHRRTNTGKVYCPYCDKKRISGT